MTSKRFGFTLIELLIVFAILGIFAAISVTILNNARIRSRDAKRVSDIQVIRAALEQHWLRNASYPLQSETLRLGGEGATVLTSHGFEDASSGEVYLANVPTDPRSHWGYYYFSDSPGIGYSLQFQTEGDTIFGAPGLYYGHSGEIDSDSTVK